MRSIRLLLAAGLSVLAVAACATSTPGWTYAPAPSATPIPSVDASASAGPSGSAGPSASAAPSASAEPSTAPSSQSAPPSASAPTAVVEVAALNIAFTPTELSVAPDVAFQINFANNDPSIPHNVAIKDAGGSTIFDGEIFNGVETRTYDVQALPAGTYQFLCTVHPNMTGTLTAQ